MDTFVHIEFNTVTIDRMNPTGRTLQDEL
jgi:hypothetical protein